MTDKAMRICDNKGFHLDLPNGVTVSVQFGPGNYCDHDCRDAEFGAPRAAMNSDENWGSNTAECAAYVTGSNLSWVGVPGFTASDGDDDGVEFYDDVVGYLDVQGVLDFINVASQLVPAANPDSVGNRMMAELEQDYNYVDGPRHGDRKESDDA